MSNLDLINNMYVEILIKTFKSGKVYNYKEIHYILSQSCKFDYDYNIWNENNTSQIRCLEIFINQILKKINNKKQFEVKFANDEKKSFQLFENLIP